MYINEDTAVLILWKVLMYYSKSPLVFNKKKLKKMTLLFLNPHWQTVFVGDGWVVILFSCLSVSLHTGPCRGYLISTFY